MRIIFGWIGGMALHTVAHWLSIRPRPALWRWIISLKSASAKVIGLAVMELWKAGKLGAMFHGPSTFLPHTAVAAFILGYFCDSLAPRILAVWPPADKDTARSRAKL